MFNGADQWFVAGGERNGQPGLDRGRQNLRVLIDVRLYRKLLRFVWTFETEEKSGLPSPETSAKMSAFEKSIFEEFENDALCVFFCIYLHNGVKEWLAYTSDVQAT